MTCMLTNPTETVETAQVIVTSPCPRAGGCALTGKDYCPDDQDQIDSCSEC